MRRKQRALIRAKANGEVFEPSRKAPMPSPKTQRLKTHKTRQEIKSETQKIVSDS